MAKRPRINPRTSTLGSRLWPQPLLLLENAVHHRPVQAAGRPRTTPLDSVATAFKFLKIKNRFKSIDNCSECLARSGDTSNSTPSWRTVR